MNHSTIFDMQNIQKDIVQFLRDIIAIPSVCGNEKAVIQRIRKEMETIGYDAVWTDGIGNLFGRIGFGNTIIAFDGHCDTVDVGNPQSWTVDPFKGEVRNGTIYGRGASDQKSGLACAVYAGKILKTLSLPHDVSFIVVASILEEDYEGFSWKYIIEQDKIVPQIVILTEPTSMGIKIGQRGRMEIKIRTRGRSCHGSTPHLGKNAIYSIAPVIKDIQRLDAALSGEWPLGKGSVVVTDIRSCAPSLCAVPDSATIHMDRRLVIGEDKDTCLKEIQNLASVKALEDCRVFVPEYAVESYTGYAGAMQAYVPAWLMQQSHPLVQTAAFVYKELLGKDVSIDAWKFSTNGVTTKGIYDIPTIGLGPGSEEYAHTPHDHVMIADLLDATSFYAALVCAWASMTGKEERAGVSFRNRKPVSK